MIILISGIKGGTGKSTISFHLAVEACAQGVETVTIDFDWPQFSMSRYYNNRKKNKAMQIWNQHHCIKQNEQFSEFEQNKLYIIDTPGRYDENIKQLHRHADIILTPVNDSMMDIDTIMQIEKDNWFLPGQYCEMIFENKKYKKDSMWIVVRNKSSAIYSKNQGVIEKKLDELSKKLNFLLLPGFKERSIFRELFALGETVLDQKKLSISHLAAKMEVKMLWKYIQESLNALNPSPSK
jgi:chromosome partitioning protein